MEIAEFLLARIAEDEAAAREATPGPWRWDEPSKDDWPQSDESLASWATGDWEPVLTGWGYDASGTHAEPADRAHIARWDPARVLSECEAKRQFLVAVFAVPMWPDEATALAVERAITALALPYAEHPDYQPEWKPLAAV